MTLGEKIFKLRKKCGLSQEELGEKINVTRQTISNWELNETTPNTEQLKKISKEFHISIDELLDNDLKNIIVEKVSNTEKLSKTSINLLKVIIVAIVTILVLFLILLITRSIVKNKDRGNLLEEYIHCSIYGEEHSFGIKYYELTGEAIEFGGDSYFSDILELEKYSDAHQIFNVINDYVKKNNGTCTMIKNKDLNDIVNISIKDGSLTKTSATIIITENIDYNITYGDAFWIEKYNYKEGKWENIKSSCYNCAFNAIGYSVTLNHPLILNQDWSRIYKELPNGLYRLVKEISFDSDRPINEDKIYKIWVEFLID